MEQSAIRLRLHFEEITNLLIAVQVAIGVDYYERRGPILAGNFQPRPGQDANKRIVVYFCTNDATLIDPCRPEGRAR